MEPSDHRNERPEAILPRNHDDVGANGEDSDIEQIWEIPEGGLDPDKEILLEHDGLPFALFSNVRITRGRWKKQLAYFAIIITVVMIILLAGALTAPAEDRIGFIVVTILLIVTTLGMAWIWYEWGRVDTRMP